MIPSKFRLIAVSADIVRSFGSDAAIWLGSAISSQDLSNNWYKESWWYCTKDQMEKQTGLTNERQESARRKLREVGVLEERRGILKRGASLATIWYSINFQVLEALVCRPESDSIAAADGGRLPSGTANDHTSVTSSVTSEEQSAATRSNVSEGKTVSSPEQQPTPVKAEARQRQRKAPTSLPAAPTIEEWHAYAKETFPWWPAVDAESAYAHYEKGNWEFKDGKPIKNWKGCARTCSNNWKRDHGPAYIASRRAAETAARAPYAPFGDN
ncbi:MAG: hypothetical protein IPM06_18550 [Rhizobiales bacterium]|nr:hypothetical protein [Hyphomicrobiales bacterium]